MTQLPLPGHHAAPLDRAAAWRWVETMMAAVRRHPVTTPQQQADAHLLWNNVQRTVASLLSTPEA